MKSSQFNKPLFLRRFQNRGIGQDSDATIQRKVTSNQHPGQPKFDAIAFREKIQKSLTEAEILFLIEQSLFKGNNIERITKSLKGEDAKNFKKISGKLKLDKNCLSRMCNVMPEITCDILVQSPTMTVGPVSLEACIKETGLDDFPSVARHSACAAIIPNDFNFRAEGLEVIMMVNMMFSERIQTAEWKSQLPPKRFRDTYVFIEKTFTSPVIKEDNRWELCRKYGILTENNEFTEPWLKTIIVANRYLKEKYRCGLETWALGVKVVDS